MLKAYFYYQVAVDKQADYIKFVSEKLKPFFEAHGAASYNVYRDIRPEQSTYFMAEMLFSDIETMRKTLGLHGTDPEYDTMLNKFFNFVSEPGVKPLGIYTQKM